MKGYPGLSNLLTEQDKIFKKRLVIKKWCAWARTLMSSLYKQHMSINELHSYIFSYIIFSYWCEF